MRGRVAELAERFDDMVSLMKVVAKLKSEGFTTEVRNLLNGGLKSQIGSKRLVKRTIMMWIKQSLNGGSQILWKKNVEVLTDNVARQYNYKRRSRKNMKNILIKSINTRKCKKLHFLNNFVFINNLSTKYKFIFHKWLCFLHI